MALCRENDVKAVDLRFIDFPGLWQHFTIPVDKLDEDVFEDGIGFDGSSIRGWQAINESDMLVVPQPDTAFLDPFTKLPTVAMICNIQDPITREDYNGYEQLRGELPFLRINTGEYLGFHGKRRLLEFGGVDVLNVHGSIGSSRAAA